MTCSNVKEKRRYPGTKPLQGYAQLVLHRFLSKAEGFGNFFGGEARLDI